MASDDDMAKRIYVSDDLHEALSVAKAKGGYRSLNNTIEDNIQLDELSE